ncbi:hypothetical protein FNT36_06925 [Hymenobacter setariae]|uniref:STAS/SEC14 domain-containing protein n=1 Tax=Hymenobacter setariae TaxID=2594794 RepID=A0A558BXE4_9BACT|nr:hypothetical protein [Hymenobacter setariae]TVT41188.1 hypothetical protein FNT36_06925 [Hymenobacter setariae]
MPAESTLLFANTAGQLAADPARFLRAHWTAQPRTLADTQALFTNMALLLQKRGWSRILVNQVAMKPFSPAEQQWITQIWLPQAVREAGYRAGAVVLSTDTYTRLATAYITTNVSGLPLRYRSFDTEADAVAWLLQQPT